MSTTLASLGFDVQTRELKGATKELENLSKASGNAERSTNSLNSASKVLRNTMFALAGAISAREVIQYSDSWRSVTNQLKQVTSSTSELLAIQQQLVSVSKDTRSSFESTANLYARLARSTTEMGLSTEDLIGITTTINQSFAASGATAMEASAAITQLSQGLASGALRGDEFNSVAEQAPGIMRAIASSLKMTTGDLREFAADGGITAEIVVNALQGASKSIADDFGKTSATFRQSLEIAKTNMMEFVGTSESINGAVSSAGDAVVSLSESIDTLIVAASGLAAAGLTAYILSAATATSAYTVVMRGAIAAQVAFNAVAAINPYVLIAASIAGAVAAIYAFTTAQESAIDVWERAKESEAAYQAAANSVGAENRIQEITKQIDSLRKLEKDAFSPMKMRKEATESLIKLEKEYHSITNARIAATKAQSAREAARAKSEEEYKIRQIELEKSLADAKQKVIDAEKAKIDMANAKDMEGFISIIDDELAGLQALKDAYGDTTKAVRDFADGAALLTQMFSLTGNEEYLRMIQRMAEDFNGVSEESADVFENEWQSASDSVAQSLQDAIASGDWSSLGKGVGNAFAASMSSIVNKTITDALAQDLTKNSSAIAQISGAFAGPIAGAVVGGMIQLAISEIGDYFSDDWDKVGERQASQGTGTVLGSINEKTRSIEKASDITSKATSELVGINRSMLRALQSVQIGIQGASARVARGSQGVQTTQPLTYSGGELLGAGFGAAMGSGFGLFGSSIGAMLGRGLEDASKTYLDAMSLYLTGNLIDFGSLLGGKSKKKDEGIRIMGGAIADMIDQSVVQGYITYRAKKHALDDYDTYEKFGAVDDDVSRQFSLVFGGIYDSVAAGLDVFGMDMQEAASDFIIRTQKISFSGMNAEDQTKAIEEYFGTVFDNLAEHTIPWLVDFQRAGEGLGETLARVATETQVVEQAVKQLGFGFASLSGSDLAEASQRLIEIGGGMEQFISSMNGFIDNFASDAQKFTIIQDSLTDAIVQAGLALPDTRSGYYDLLKAQDGATESGAKNIATLLRLQGVASEYYATLEEGAEVTLNAQRNALDSAKSAASIVDNALKGLSVSGRDNTSREAALASISQMTRTGAISSTDDLRKTLASATNINANDFESFNDYIRTVARTGQALTGLKGVTDAKVSREEQLLMNIERKIEIMTGELSAVGLANAKNTAKTSRILERIELDGLEVRSE